jgi:uncharacterized protein (TIGR03067 family)
MKKLLCGVVCVALAAVVTTQGGDKKPAKIEGTWLGISGITDGKKIPDEVIEKIMLTVTVKAGKYSVSVDGKEVEAGTYKTDDSKKPPYLDLTITEGKDKGKTQLGIYKLDGDNLTVAFTTGDNKERPKDFKGGEGLEVSVLKRKK